MMMMMTENDTISRHRLEIKENNKSVSRKVLYFFSRSTSDKSSLVRSSTKHSKYQT